MLLYRNQSLTIGLYCLLPLSLIVILFGIYFSPHELVSYWTKAARQALTAWGLSVLLICGLLCWWRGRNAAKSFFAIVIPSLLFLYTGIPTGLAVAYLLGSLYLSGYGLYGLLFGGYRHCNHCAFLLLGLAIVLAVFGTAIHFPINYQLGYIACLGLPWLLLLSASHRQRLLQGLKQFIADYREGATKLGWIYLLIFAWVSGYVASYALMPMQMSDDMNYHLGMWTQLQYHHQYLFDARMLIWSVAPFAVDLLHAIASVIAVDNARPSFNVVLFALLLCGLWSVLSRLLQNPAARLLLLLLFVSTPMLANLMTSLQTDLFLALLAVAGATLLFDSQSPNWQRLLLMFVVGCVMVAIKAPMVLLGGTLFLALLFNLPRGMWVPQEQKLSVGIIVFALIAIAVGLHSYVVAYVVTGNPMFPLYNGIFKSPLYFANNFKDPVYTQGASFTAYWGLYFNTDRYFESRAFVAGFQYLFLVPIAIIFAFISVHRRLLLWLLLPIIVYTCIMFYLMQYLRYLFAIAPLAIVLLAAILAKNEGNKLARYVLWLYLSLNIFLLPGISFQTHFNPWKSVLDSEREEVLGWASPEYLMNAYVNQHYGQTNVLFDVIRGNGSTLAGRPYYLCWCAPTNLWQADTWKTDSDVLAFLKERDIQLVYWFKPNEGRNDYFRAQIKSVIDQYGELEHEVGGLALYRIHFPNEHFRKKQMKTIQ